MQDKKITKVSIICNTYNHEKYIEQALNSFLKQKTNFEYEVLIHDDASTDKTAEIVSSYQRKYPSIIKPILQRDNQLSKGVKIGFEYQYPRASGEYIAFCEGDDYWIDENKLQRQADFLDKHKEYVSCVHRYIVVDEESITINKKTFGYYEAAGDYTFWHFFEKELPSQLATLMCRNVFIEPFVSKMRKVFEAHIQGDIKLHLCLLSLGPCYRMGEVMSAYRFVQKPGGGSWTSRQYGKPTAMKTWRGLRELENNYYDAFGVRIKLKQRRIASATGVYFDFLKYPSIETFKDMISIPFYEPFSTIQVAKQLMKKIIK